MKRFVQYAAAGSVATAAHYLVLVALVEAGLTKPPMGSVSGAVVGAAIAYLLNRRLAFASTTVPHSAAILRFAGVAAIGAALNGGIVAGLSTAVHAHYIYSQIVATVIVLLMTYVTNKIWTFRLSARS